MSASEKLSDMLREKLSGMTPDEIAARLGYSRPSRATETLRDILKDPQKVLQKGFYDFRFTAAEMLEKIIEIAGINPDTAQGLIEELNADIHDEQFGFSPWIEVDAKAKPMSSGMIHMILGHYLRIGLPESIKREPRERQLEVLKEAVRKHRDWLVKQNQNPLQAAPRRYICHINSADDIIELDPDGEIFRESPRHGMSIGI